MPDKLEEVWGEAVENAFSKSTYALSPQDIVVVIRGILGMVILDLPRQLPIIQKAAEETGIDIGDILAIFDRIENNIDEISNHLNTLHLQCLVSMCTAALMTTKDAGTNAMILYVTPILSIILPTIYALGYLDGKGVKNGVDKI